MTNQKNISIKDTEKYARRIDELRNSLASFPASKLAHNTNTRFIRVSSQKGHFIFNYWKNEIKLSYPEFDIHPIIQSNKTSANRLSILDRLIILYYFSFADNAKPADKWIAFTELKDGRFYNAAFYSYTSRPLVSRFQNKRELFEKNAEQVGGERIIFADTAFVFQILPRVKILTAYWEGDEDFPASIHILFDGSANHYLPTDGYAILGNILTRKLLKASSQN